MLTKPISLSPSGETISVDDGIITLTAQLPRSCQLETFEVDGAEYCYATLILHTNNYDYTFEPDVTFPTIIKHKHYNSVQIKLITEKNFRCVRWGSRSGAQKTIYLKDILRSNDTYSWNLRILERTSVSDDKAYVSQNVIAYGAISDVEKRGVWYLEEQGNAWLKQDTTTSEYIVKITPHTNIYDAVVGVGKLSGFTAYSQYAMGQYTVKDHIESNILTRDYIRSTVYDVLKKHSENLKYYILINGKQFPIKYYRFFPALHKDIDIVYNWGQNNGFGFTWNIDMKNEHCYEAIAPYFDSYGNPLYGYAIIDGSYDVDSYVSEGDTYTICCNYIDSSNAYFDIHAEPEITVHSTDGNVQLYMTDDNNVNKFYRATKAYPYTLNSSKLSLNISYLQSEGVDVNYHSYKMYEYDELQNEYVLKYTSGNLYTKDLTFVYDEFLTEKIYKLVISIVDTVSFVNVYLPTFFRCKSGGLLALPKLRY